MNENEKMIDLWAVLTDFYKDCDKAIAELGGEPSEYMVQAERGTTSLTLSLVRVKKG